jgi:hypothetical protein
MPPEPTPLDPLDLELEAEAVADEKAAPQSPASLTELDDPFQETDVWWGAYCGRTMVPTFALCMLLSVNISLAFGWFWDDLHLNPQLQWHLAVCLIAAVWIFPLALWIHNTLSRTYRLTTRCLYRDRGFRRPADGQVDLARIKQVRVHFTILQRFLGVGRIIVDTDAAKPFVLDGVYDPEPVARLIRRWSERAQKMARDPHIPI